ncbi:hypothetical protein [Thalassobacillus hwangdonensis]|uniref:Uncharacterized protein n=1 Tax=Thalassobacillus hwangdonensis TaxID=546108 RepID=A0ABW3KY44_9BACI
MKLFQSVIPYTQLNFQTNKVSTPFGTMCFPLILEGNAVTDKAEKAAYMLDSGATVLSYEGETYTAELLIGEVLGNFQNNIEVDVMIAAVWRVRVNQQTNECTFKAFLEPGDCDDFSCGPDSGENLESLQFINDAYMMNLGTEDGASLLSRATNGGGMPAAFSTRYPFEQCYDYVDIVKYDRYGLTLPLSSIQSGEMCQAHFVLALKEGVDEEDASTWIAVDRKGEDLLAEHGIS